MHCRNLNPHVASALTDWRSQARLASTIARTGTAAAQERAELPVAGTSSFGMSGTNAHLMLTAEGEVPEADLTAPVWQRSR